MNDLKKHAEEISSASNDASAPSWLSVLECLDMLDRNGSTAEEWAAGRGHFECLEYLLDLRERCVRQREAENNGNNMISAHDASSDSQTQQYMVKEKATKKRKKREQKSALHWAARHGHIKCVDLILDRGYTSVNEASGDGTTALHFACYGGQLSTVSQLISRGADTQKCNDWGCNSSHWAAMSVGECDGTIQVCNYLRHSCNVPFHLSQRQGHTPLHKAAQKKNEHVIRWMYKCQEDGGAGLSDTEKKEAGQPDHSGNKPSDIFIASGGDESLAKWMSENSEW